jgi:hypothetical protein
MGGSQSAVAESPLSPVLDSDEETRREVKASQQVQTKLSPFPLSHAVVPRLLQLAVIMDSQIQAGASTTSLGASLAT